MRIRSAGTPLAGPLRPLAVAAAAAAGLTCLLLPAAPAAEAAPPQEICGQPPPTPTVSPSLGTSPPGPPGITLCLTEHLLTRPSRMRPGQDADYTIAVQAVGVPAPAPTPTGTPPASTPPAPTAANVTVALTAATGAPVPAFTSCPAGKGTSTCALGTLTAGSPASTLRADLAIPPTATTGQQLTFTITVTTSTTGVFPAASTQALTVAAAPTPAPASSSASPAATQTSADTPAATTPAAAAATTGTTGTSALGALATLPPLNTSAIAATSSQLSFPTVIPGPSLLPSPASLPPAHQITATAATDQYPLTRGQLGLQAIGLAILAAGLILALTRLSVRRRPGDDSGDAR